MGLSIEQKLWDTPTDSLTLRTKLIWARDVATGMAFIHERKFLHRDLKSPNILYSIRTGRAKIADFGIGRSFEDIRRSSKQKTMEIVSLSRTEQKDDDDDHVDWGVSSMTSDVGSLPWMAPEVMTSPDNPEYIRNYSPAIDCYSYGVVMWELMSHARPWSVLEENNHSKKKSRRISVDIIKNVRSGKRPFVPKHAYGMPSKYVELMNRCWDQDPSKRPHFKNIVEIVNVLYSENESRDRNRRERLKSSQSRKSSNSSSSSRPSRNETSSMRPCKADSIAIAVSSSLHLFKSRTSTSSSSEFEMSSSYHSPSVRRDPM